MSLGKSFGLNIERPSNEDNSLMPQCKYLSIIVYYTKSIIKIQ